MVLTRVITFATFCTVACATGGADVVRRSRLSVSPAGMVQPSGFSKSGDSVVRKAASKRTQKWIYAIQTCAKEKYVNQLKGQLSTWAKNLTKDQVLIVGGPYNNGEGKFACEEGSHGQNCKEATVLYRGAARAEEVGADWLYHVIDDAYIFLPRVWKAMEQFDPSEPMVFADFGCGRKWKYHPDSEGGTKPKPTRWVDPEATCEGVEQKGGMCTGAGYILSRGALKLLRQNYTLASFPTHYRSMSKGYASDLTTTCLFYDRGITVHNYPRKSLMRAALVDTKPEVLARDPGVALVHIILSGNHSAIPGYMHALHQAEEVNAMQDESAWKRHVAA